MVIAVWIGYVVIVVMLLFGLKALVVGCSLLRLMVIGLLCAVNSVVMYDSLYITFACSFLCVCLGCY